MVGVAQLNNGQGILTKDSCQLMQTMVARGQAGIASRVEVGLGWKFGQTGGRIYGNCPNSRFATDDSTITNYKIQSDFCLNKQ